MFKINKKKPTFFEQSKRKIRLPKISNAWEKISEIRSSLREYILSEEQNGLCGYCERKITSDSNESNIDHFKTRNLFPEETLNYDNLLVSCNRKETCATHKDQNIKTKNEYSKIINPVADNPDKYFEYLPTGEIISKGGNSKAKFTIDIFNLGKKESDYLVQRRKQLTKAIDNIDLPLNEILELMEYEFQSFIKNIYYKLKSKGVTQ